MRILLGLILLTLSVPAVQAAPLDHCADHLPFGVPSVTGSHLSPVCHAGYAAAIDEKALVPRWVAYRLTADHAIGCNRRQDDFHAEEQLPASRRAQPADYEGSGFDRGHMAPAEDFAWSADRMSDSFSMANMAPQRPGLNREEWEHLEETVRAWALARGELIIYTGPVLPTKPQTIGDDGVAVPTAFWKIVIDPNQRQALAFMMPQRTIKKGDLRPWQTSPAAVEQAAGIKLSLPAGIDESAMPKLWPASIAGWRAEKKRVCG
jgi:endonuclease G